MGREECRSSCRGVIVGTPLAGEASDFVIRELLTPSGWKRCSGLVRLKNCQSFRYGDELQVTGGMVYPEAHFYRRHLMTLGIRHELDCEIVEKTGTVAGWRRIWGSILKLREAMAARLTEGFQSQRLNGLYLAMVMGRRDLFSRADRETFVRSATIHVFAISGLHVNCLMISTFLILRMLYLTKRLARLMALPLVCFYVLLTGAGPSSLRALIMLYGAGLALGMYRRGNNRHALCLSAMFLLLANPLYLKHIGFQFSFLVVATLIYGQPLQLRLERLLMERRHWRLRTKWRILSSQWTRKGTGMVVSCCLAWWGGLALTLHVNRLLSLGALMVNCGVQPMAALMVVMAVPKVLLSILWPNGSRWMGRCLELCMEYMVGLARWGGQDALCRGTLELSKAWACLFAGLMIAVLAGYQNRDLRFWGAGVMALIVVAISLQEPEKLTEVRLFRSEKGRRTCIVTLSDGRRRAEVLLTGCEESANMAMEWMRRNGVVKVEALYAENGAAGYRGMHEWVCGMPVASVVMDIDCRDAGETVRLMASGVHVSFYDRLAEVAEYRHGGEVCQMRCGSDEVAFRYENKDNGIILFFDEGMEGVALLSFISNKKVGGSLVAKTGGPSRTMGLPLE